MLKTRALEESEVRNRRRSDLPTVDHARAHHEFLPIILCSSSQISTLTFEMVRPASNRFPGRKVDAPCGPRVPSAPYAERHPFSLPALRFEGGLFGQVFLSHRQYPVDDLPQISEFLIDSALQLEIAAIHTKQREGHVSNRYSNTHFWGELRCDASSWCTLPRASNRPQHPRGFRVPKDKECSRK
jgi:hypothetical protein